MTKSEDEKFTGDDAQTQMREILEMLLSNDEDITARCCPFTSVVQCSIVNNTERIAKQDNR